MRRLCLALSSLLLLSCGDGSSSETGASTEPVGSGEIHEIQIRVGEFVFDARAAGPENGEPVLLLHGFPQTSWEWKHQLEALGLAGYRAVAPNQRGYSPGARPPNADDYALSLLVDDALGVADTLGWDRFHLVGHDWGATVAWTMGVVAPERLLTITPISIPHLDAFSDEIADPTSCQYEAAWYIELFVLPDAADVLLADDSEIIRSNFEGLSIEDVEMHLATVGNRDTLDAGLNWYRANFSQRGQRLTPTDLGPVTVDTMFIWSDQDIAVCREGAEATADYVTGPYRFEILEGVNHWVPENAADRVSALLLDHLA